MKQIYIFSNMVRYFQLFADIFYILVHFLQRTNPKTIWYTMTKSEATTFKRIIRIILQIHHYIFIFILYRVQYVGFQAHLVICFVHIFWPSLHTLNFLICLWRWKSREVRKWRREFWTQCWIERAKIIQSSFNLLG